MDKIITIPEETLETRFSDITAKSHIADSNDIQSQLQAEVHDGVLKVEGTYNEYKRVTKASATEEEKENQKTKHETTATANLLKGFGAEYYRRRLEEMKNRKLTDEDREWLKENEVKIAEILKEMQDQDTEPVEESGKVVLYEDDEGFALNPNPTMSEEETKLYLNSAIQTKNSIENALVIKTPDLRDWIASLVTTGSKLSNITKGSIFQLSFILAFILLIDVTTWHMIGTESFGMNPWKAVLFCLLPLPISKFIGIGYESEIEGITRSGKSYSTLFGFWILIASISLIALSGGANMHASSQLEEVRNNEADATLGQLAKALTSAPTPINELDNKQTQPSDASITRQKSFYSELQLYSSVLLKLLFALSILWVGGLFYAKFTLEYRAYKINQDFQNARQKLLAKLSEYDSHLGRRRLYLQQLCHINGLKALYFSKKANYGTK